MHRFRGFTLVELLIVVMIVALLATIAIPSYQDYVRKGRRTDAMRVLQEIRMLEERFRADRPRYGTLVEIGYAPPASIAPYYTVTVATVAPDPLAVPPVVATFTVTADGVVGGGQDKDMQDGVSCDTLTLDQAGTKGPVAAVSCWRQ